MPTTAIDVNGVRTSIDKLTKLIAEQNGAMNDIEKQVRFLSNVWDGSAQKAFAEEFVKTKKEVTEFNSTLQDYVDMMQRSVDKFETLDGALRNSFNK